MGRLYTPRHLTSYVPVGMVAHTDRYVMRAALMPEPAGTSRHRLIAATIDLVRSNGYASTRVEDVCAAAGVTKGSFFHHFESKEDLAIAAARQWGAGAVDLFAHGPYMAEADPLARLLGYLRFRRELISGAIREWSCYAGTAIQETHETHPAIRVACADSIEVHLAQLTKMIEQALARYPVPRLRAESLALHLQGVIQGAFVMAKARQDAQVAIDNIDHVYRYVELLFSRTTRKKRPR
jgi:TetR/AcrR family transcriptional regulator, transcriptional repressor for nem operon